MVWVIFGILAVLLVGVWLMAPRVVPWADQMTRLNAGAGAKAEWMAPPQVVEDVIWSYREGQEWVATCAANWGRFAEGLERYTIGMYYKQQARALASLVEQRPRLSAELSATHTYGVRHFSSDGLRCLLIDGQTARVIHTGNYWGGDYGVDQRLEDATFVYQMAYVVGEKRWKIERLIQQLPLGTPWEAHPTKKARVRVAANLPAPAGRDS